MNGTLLYSLAGYVVLHPPVSQAAETSKPQLATRLLWDRKGAAQQLSISVRSLDYLIAGRQLGTRRIGKKVLVPCGELVRFAAANHHGTVVATQC